MPRRFSCRDLRDAVRRARRPNEMQADLAARAGTSPGTICHILLGKDRGINLATAQTIAQRLGFRLEEKIQAQTGTSTGGPATSENFIG